VTASRAFVRVEFEPAFKHQVLDAAERNQGHILPEDDTIVIVVPTSRHENLKSDLGAVDVSGKWVVTDLGTQAPDSFNEAALLTPQQARGELRS